MVLDTTLVKESMSDKNNNWEKGKKLVLHEKHNNHVRCSEMGKIVKYIFHGLFNTKSICERLVTIIKLDIISTQDDCSQ